MRSGSVFRDVLESLRDRVEGTLAVSLIALDGIAIEAISEGSVPLEVIGAEFGGFIKSVRLSNTDLNTGDVLQLSLITEKYITLLSEVTPEYFLLLVMRPDGNYGRARHELAKAKYSLRDELV
jgi:predicted regulator of Ras-like GTPase activity (Roadblock/LC7/MglB family)